MKHIATTDTRLDLAFKMMLNRILISKCCVLYPISLIVADLLYSKYAITCVETVAHTANLLNQEHIRIQSIPTHSNYYCLNISVMFPKGDAVILEHPERDLQALWKHI